MHSANFTDVCSNEELRAELEQLRLQVAELQSKEAELVQVKEKLLASENLLHSILNNSPNLIEIKDLKGRRILANRLFEQISQLAPELDRQTLEVETPSSYETQYYYENELHSYLETKFPLFDSHGALYGLAMIATNVTQLKKAEESLRKKEDQLRQSQKMEALGRLTGGIAHDFNNLLTAIIGYAELTALRLSEDDPTRQDIEQIRNQAERAATLVRQLLAFSRQQILQPQVFNLNEIVQSMENLLQRLIGEDIEFSTRLDPQAEPVQVDQSQFEQVIINLAVNARDAMPDGGKLVLQTQNIELSEEYARQKNITRNCVLFSISDTGCGIPENIRTHIFEPFFTTKAAEQGTGLGLSIVYGIVQQSGGNIEVYSEPGKGTTFKIYLPQVSTKSRELKPTMLKPELPRGSETVLVVEDDTVIRSLVTRVLERHGYKVLEAAGVRQAVRICQTYSKPINLLITDVIMPEASGPKLARQLQELRPSLAVLYMSGYTNGIIAYHGVTDAEVSFLQKPFTPDALLYKVAQLLSGLSDWLPIGN